MPICWIRYDEQFRLKRRLIPHAHWGHRQSFGFSACSFLSHKTTILIKTSVFRAERQFNHPSCQCLSPPPPLPTKVCRYFNQGNCRFPNCNSKYVCSKCAAPSSYQLQAPIVQVLHKKCITEFTFRISSTKMYIKRMGNSGLFTTCHSREIIL